MVTESPRIFFLRATGPALEPAAGLRAAREHTGTQQPEELPGHEQRSARGLPSIMGKSVFLLSAPGFYQRRWPGRVPCAESGIIGSEEKIGKN